MNTYKYFTVDDLQNQAGSIISSLNKDDTAAIITQSGKPSAVLLDVSHSDIDQLLSAIISAKATLALDAIQAHAAKHGYMTEQEIEAELSLYRQEKREHSSK